MSYITTWLNKKITSCGLYWREYRLRKKYEVTEDEHQDTDPSNFFQKGTKVIRKTSRTGKNDIIEGVCYNPLDQEEQADEAYGWVGGMSHSQALLLMGNISQPPWCLLGDNIGGCKQTGRLLECIDGNFHLQMRSEPIRRGSLLDVCFLHILNVKIRKLSL